jgi:hypothetical protein
LRREFVPWDGAGVQGFHGGHVALILRLQARDALLMKSPHRGKSGLVRQRLKKRLLFFLSAGGMLGIGLLPASVFV